MATKSATGARKRPAQARSRAMVEAILDAAARVLVTDGYEAFSTNRVAEAAGASVGSLYQYVPNKSALLAELMRRHAQVSRQDRKTLRAQVLPPHHIKQMDAHIKASIGKAADTAGQKSVSVPLAPG